MSEKIMLLDGHSLMSRAFYGLPDLTSSSGMHTNAILGFLNIMLHYIEEEKPTHLLVAFDRKEPTFRHLKYKEYKGTRKPLPREMTMQVPVMMDLLKTMEIPVVSQPGLEADDILGTIGKTAEGKGYEVVIVSGDRDLLQLAGEKIKIKIPKTRAGATVTEDYYADDVVKLYGVSPEEFIDMKGLMGDTSDNIPGVPGIGEKTAGKLIAAYHSIENAYAHLDEIKPKKAKENLGTYYDQALMSRDLARIRTDAELSYDFQDAVIGKLFTPAAYQEFKELELKSLYHYFEDDDKDQTGFDLRIIENKDDFSLLFNEITSCECLGLGFLEGRDRLLGCSLSWDDGEKENNILALTGAGLLENDIADGIVSLLKAGVKIYLLDYKELLYLFPEAGSYEDQIEDTGLCAYLLSPLQSGYDYEDLARDYLGMTLPSRKELFGKKKPEEVFDPADEKMLQFAAGLARIPLMAGPLIKEKLSEKGMDDLYHDIEHPVTATLYDMERFGIRVEKDALLAYGEQLTGRIKELENAIWEEAGKNFNINSPKQLGVILFEDMGMPFAKKTKTGYSTSADVLEKLAPRYPIVQNVLEYRQLSKLKSTYADGLAAFIREDGKIHGRFHQKVTATGRLSSSDPNLQNIPIRMPLGREIRKVFVPDPGYIFISADYSQIELRVLAHLAGDKNLIDAYAHGEDIHAITASQVFGVELSQVTPALRRNAKAVNFGIVYGISAFGLGQDLAISQKEAKEYINKYFATYPGIKKYLDDNVALAKKEGYVKTLYGRIRPIPELSSGNFMQRSFGERVAMNSPVQGTAADIIKIAMIRVSRRLKEEKLASRLILQIHDELLIETKKEEEEAVIRILKEEMTGAANLRVPLLVDVEKGTSWYDAK